MRVAIDGTPLLGPRTGVGEWTHGVITHLAAREDVEITVYAITFDGRHDLAGAIPTRARPAVRPVPARAVRELWDRTPHPRIERWTGPVDVVHGTNFIGPPAAAPVVVTIHDLTFVRYPELCTPDTLRYPRSIRRALERGAHVQVDSDFVGAEVRDAFGLDAGRVSRIYPGLSAIGEDVGARPRPSGRPRTVLALGTIEPRKNTPALVAAFDRVAATDRELELLIVGPDGWGADELTDAIAAAHHRDRIRRLGWVDTTRRAQLLADATVFAYPSRYEGFGFPPLEAMAAGVPVVATRAGSIPEVVGNAAELVEPDDVDALAGALDRVLTDDGRRRELITRGRDQIRRYSWTRTTTDLVELYRKLA